MAQKYTKPPINCTLCNNAYSANLSGADDDQHG
jgi:hypothetical protein